MSRRALLIATGHYSDPRLPDLSSALVDAQGLKEVLADAQIGNFDVTDCVDSPGQECRTRIEGFFAQASRDEQLLLYISGHGVKDKEGKLYFGASDTNLDFLRATGISAGFIHEVSGDNPSRRVVMIIDTCFSGAFAKGIIKAGEQAVNAGEHFNGGGRVVITASNAYQYALAADSSATLSQPSLLSKHIIQGLRTGTADIDGDGHVTTEDLFKYVHTCVAAETEMQRPQRWTFGLERDLIVASNPLPRPGKLPQEVVDLIESAAYRARLLAVEDLENLLAEESRALVLAAREALELLSQDPDRRVSRAAAAVLHEDVERVRVREIAAAQRADLERHAAAQETAAGQAEQQPHAGELRIEWKDEYDATWQADEILAIQQVNQEREAEPAQRRRLRQEVVDLLTQDVVDLIENPALRARLLAVEDLRDLLVTAPEPLAQAAREALELMLEDDDPRVSEAAASLLKQAQQAQEAEALIKRGVRKRQQGDAQGAIRDYTAAIELPGAPPSLVAAALNNRGRLKDQQGYNQGAISDHTAAIELPGAPPDQVAQALVNRGISKSKRGDTKGAISDLTTAIELPDAPLDQVARALVGRGITKSKRGDTKGAISDYTVAIELPGAPPDLVARAQKLHQALKRVPLWRRITGP
jgi:tetratricopeptide (TPR) repeat protein